MRIENGVLLEIGPGDIDENGVVNIPDGVTSIGNDVFYGCSNLTRVNIPNGVINIGDNAFADCSGLISVNIPNSVTRIGDNAFAACRSLIKANIPDSVISMGNGVFYDCRGIVSVTMPDSVTSMGDRMFYGCSSLMIVNIPSNVTSIGDRTFLGCSSLTTVHIPKAVTSIGEGAFFDCNSLTRVNIPDSVTSIGDNAFLGCSSLTRINIPESVTSIGENAFRNCDNLGGVNIQKDALLETKSRVDKLVEDLEQKKPEGIKTVSKEELNEIFNYVNGKQPDISKLTREKNSSEHTKSEKSYDTSVWEGFSVYRFPNSPKSLNENIGYVLLQCAGIKGVSEQQVRSLIEGSKYGKNSYTDIMANRDWKKIKNLDPMLISEILGSGNQDTSIKTVKQYLDLLEKGKDAKPEDIEQFPIDIKYDIDGIVRNKYLKIEDKYKMIKIAKAYESIAKLKEKSESTATKAPKTHAEQGKRRHIKGVVTALGLAAVMIGGAIIGVVQRNNENIEKLPAGSSNSVSDTLKPESDVAVAQPQIIPAQIDKPSWELTDKEKDVVNDEYKNRIEHDQVEESSEVDSNYDR